MSDKEPFILASQAQQVFYVADPIDKDWNVVIKTTPRNLCNMTEEEQMAEADDYLQSESFHVSVSEDLLNDDNIDWGRSGIYGDLLDVPTGLLVPEPSSNTEIPEENHEEENELRQYEY
ncbi:hypothetical protein LINGRAHAP2_LOCUS32875 [Linum grandiflorum]